MPSSKSATLLGAGAILLWATLASLTAATGTIPPFETTAIVFAIGGILVAAHRAAAGPGGAAAADAGFLCVGSLRLLRLPRALFRGPKARPAGGGEPDYLAVGAADGAVLEPAAGTQTARWTRRRALLGLSAATMLIWDKLGAGGDVASHRSALRWRSPARSCGRAIPSPRACSPPCRAKVSPRRAWRHPRSRSSAPLFERWVTPPILCLAGAGGPGHRPGRRRLHAVGHRHEEAATCRCWACSPTPRRSCRPRCWWRWACARRPGRCRRVRADGGGGDYRDAG